MLGMNDDDWGAYHSTIATPTADPERPFGAYAVAARKRRQGVCPFAAKQNVSASLPSA
jgi:hypothetical protein